MKKRVLAVVLCLAMLIGYVPYFAFTAQASNSLNIYQDGVLATAASLPQNKSVNLEAFVTNGSQYQWQILIYGDNWVNITGGAGSTLKVTYAMIASLCNGGAATLRVKALSNGEEVTSGNFTVYVTDPVIEPSQENSEEEKYVVQDAPDAIIHDTPVSETTAPTQAPTETPTEAPTEAPTQAPTESTAAADLAAAETACAEAAAAYDQAAAAYDQAAADLAAKQTAYEAAAAARASAEAAVQASAVVTTIPAEVTTDENGETVVLTPESTSVSFDEALVAAANAAAAEEAAALEARNVAQDALTQAESNKAAAEANKAAAEAALNAAQAAAEAAETQPTANQPAETQPTVTQPAETTPVTKAPTSNFTFRGSSNYALTNNDPSSQAEDETTATTAPAGVKPTYNVVINFEFENNELAADPYTATLAAGENFSATVPFPTVQGYLPYYNENQQDSLELNFTPIDKNYTYKVVYKPTNVNYTVIHYQQNLDNDNYTEVARETKQGLTKSKVPEVAKTTYTGFYALLYEKPEIAADGSTLVEIYYDRYYYLMNFDLDGGYDVEPIYARYGTSISGVGTPQKAGYTFKGWTRNGDAATIPSTMPAENRTYTALWQAKDTAKVTVVFWGENADDEKYSHIRSAQIDLTPGTSFTYSEEGSLTCTQEEHEHKPICYTCGDENHAHGTGCYDNVGRRTIPTPILLPNNPSNGYIHREISLLRQVIYIDGNWYVYTGSAKDGSVVSPSCGKNAHEHSDKCIGCGKAEHAHSSDCYVGGAGLDSGLWTFVKSDTVTVAADGSSVVNVYYDRTERTLTFNYNYSSNRYQTTETITAKWGADISTQYKAIADKAGSTFWTENSNGNGPYTNYIGIMPQTNMTYYNRGASGNSGTMTYYGEDLNGNGDYTVTLFSISGVGGYKVTDEDRYQFEGFTYSHGAKNGDDCGGAKFYYTRNRYTLTFNDGYNDVDSKSVLYEASLSTYSSFVPDVPSGKEPGSVRFGGWYLNPECSGAEYKLDEHKMPADNVLLYAKWVPVEHTVSFYLDQAAYEAETKLSTHPDIKVSHGSLAGKIAEPENGSYTFVGWFYLENGEEKAFDFENMPVKKDLQVYGKWSSNVLKQYFIYYKVQDTDTEIADPTTGSGLAGTTKTFDAKGGTDLYADYQEGYFPVTKSHSLTIDINATKENNTNVYTFWYVQKAAVPYTVKYLNKETGLPVAPEKTVSKNRKAVVTETFVPVSGMMPDAYQKRLVVSGEDGAVNEIIFYYTEDTTHAYYKITHYTENTAEGTWTEYASSQAVGDIGTTYKADPMTISGFTYNPKVEGTVVSGELTANGLELKLYYTRNSYPYQVRYLEQGTGKQLAEPKNGTGKYGQVVSESAITIENYTPVDPASQTLNIKIEESDTPALNIITFYYTEKEVTINYVVVGPDGCGTVTPTSETVKVLSGAAQGSTAAVTGNSYKFVGWYSEAACDNLLSTDSKYTPTKADGAAWVDRTTYYAKFEWNVADLTITKQGSQQIDEHQSFIFTVTGADDVTRGTSVKVVITGNGSVTIKGLLIGAYTVTEDTNWSWRYSTSNGGDVNLIAGGSSIIFENSRSKGQWLSGDSVAENQFTINGSVASN